MKVKKDIKIKIAKWDEKLKKLAKNLEPPRWLIKQIHEMYSQLHEKNNDEECKSHESEQPENSKFNKNSQYLNFNE